MLLLLPTDIRKVCVIPRMDVASLCHSAASCRDMRDGTNELRQSFFRIRAVIKWALPSNSFRVVVRDTIASQVNESPGCNAFAHTQQVIVTGFWRSASILHGLGANASDIRRPFIEFLSIGKFVIFPGQQSFFVLKTLCPALLDAPFFDDVFRGVYSFHLAFKEYEYGCLHPGYDFIAYRQQELIVITVTTALGTLELLGDIITSGLSGARSTAEPHPFINEVTHINWTSILFRKA